MKLRNVLIPIAILSLSLSLAHAMNVSVIIQFPSETKIYVVNVSDNATAKDALIATGLNTTWSYGGKFLNCISGVCGVGASKWWCFTYKRHGKWVFSNVGLASYRCSEGDVMGLRFLQSEDSAKCFKCFSGCDYETIEKYCAPSFSRGSDDVGTEDSKHILPKVFALLVIFILSIKILNRYQKR